MTQHQGDLWSVLAQVRNGTFVHPDTLVPQFQVSAASRDTLAAYCESTKLIVAQSADVDALSEAKAELERTGRSMREVAERAEVQAASLAEKLAETKRELLHSRELVKSRAEEVSVAASKHANETRRLTEGHREALAAALASANQHQADAEALREILSAERQEQREKGRRLSRTGHSGRDVPR